MCDMLLSQNVSGKELEFIVYNVAFSERSGKFTTEHVYQQLKQHKIHTDKHILEQFFEQWADLGLIFEDANEYVINTRVEL